MMYQWTICVMAFWDFMSFSAYGQRSAPMQFTKMTIMRSSSLAQSCNFVVMFLHSTRTAAVEYRPYHSEIVLVG